METTLHLRNRSKKKANAEIAGDLSPFKDCPSMDQQLKAAFVKSS
jgi:hypothetical protein